MVALRLLYPHFNYSIFYSLTIPIYSIFEPLNSVVTSNQMATATAKPQKRLRDFLNEQQEPFILEVYLLEREPSKRWSLNEDWSNNSEKSDSSGLNKKRKALLPFCKVLTILQNKLAFHSKSNILTREHDQRKEKHASVPQPGWVDHIAQFSSASRSIMFNSPSDFEEGTSISSHKDQHLVSSHIFQTSNVCNMSNRRRRQRCIEGSPQSLGKIPPSRFPNVNEDFGGMQQRIRSYSVLLPKKVTEDSLLSAAIWSLLGPSIKKEECSKELAELLARPNVSQIVKSKRILHKIKKLLFDCGRDITITLPTKDDRKQGYKQFVGPLELGKLICVRTKQWGQHARDGANITYSLTLDYARDGANITYSLTLDYLNSSTEWNKFESYVKDIGVEITDAILETMNHEILSELIGTLAPHI